MKVVSQVRGGGVGALGGLAGVGSAARPKAHSERRVVAIPVKWTILKVSV